jgi:hypothetical protein
MINIQSLVADEAVINAINAAEISADNITAGTIYSEDKKSWFNLTNGEFELGDTLSYTGGVLTISGSKGDAEETLKQLGLLQNDVDAAAQAAEDAKQEVSSMEVGGRNYAVYSTAELSGTNKINDYGFVQSVTDTRTDFNLSINNYTGVPSGATHDNIGNKIINSIGKYQYTYTLKNDTSKIRVGHSGGTVDNYSIFILPEVINAGTTITVSLEITNITQGSFTWKNVMIVKGNKSIDFVPALEDTDAKITALDYLKDALTDGSTEIAGGLTMTNVLMLRNLGTNGEDGSVTAGMSGLTTYNDKEDKVLLWGGGTYEEAFAAANSDTYETGSGAITTLLKKDGTGKIGVFHIEEDQVQVKTNDGAVVIDDIDGLSCKIQSQEHAAVLVTPKELKTFDELKELGESINRNYEYPSPFNNDISYTIHESFGPKYGFSNRTSFKVFVGSGGTIKISGNIKYTPSQIDDRYNQGPNKISIGSQSYDGISCEIYNSKGEQINKTNTFVSDDDRSFINITVPTADTYTIEAYARIYIDFDLHMLEQEELERGVEVEMTLLDNTYLRIETNYQIAEQQTMVAYKGIFSYQGDKAYFYYKDGVGLDCQIGNVRFSVNDKGILINGLQKGSSGLTKGMLYNDNGTLKIVQ